MKTRKRSNRPALESRDAPSWLSARALSARTLSILPSARHASITRESHVYPFDAAREPSGTPLLYLPVKSPEASGDQMVVP